MSFEKNNRYWLNCFMKDFFNEENDLIEDLNLRFYEINEFSNKFAYKKKTKDYLNNIMRQYSDVLASFAFKTRTNNIKLKLNNAFRNFLKKCDGCNNFDLKQIRLDFIELREMSESGMKFYLIACDINSDIDFELTYGTLKTLNTI